MPRKLGGGADYLGEKEKGRLDNLYVLIREAKSRSGC